MRAFIPPISGLLVAAAAYAEPAERAEAKPAATMVAQAPKIRYTTIDTELGATLDDPAATDIVEKHVPDLTRTNKSTWPVR